MIKVKGYNGLIKNTINNAIVATDTQAYKNYMNAKKTQVSKDQEIKDLKDELKELKTLVNSIISKSKSKK